MNNKRIMSIITILLSVIIGIAYYTYVNWDNKLIYTIHSSETEPSAITSEPTIATTISEEEAFTDQEVSPVDNPQQVPSPAVITVFLYGSIKHNGIYQVYEGARVYEVLALAGGLETEADMGFVNQARRLVDGESIFFPTKEEAKALPKASSRLDETSSQEKASENATENILVDINTADKAQLMMLPGIGEAKAMSIVSYREEMGLFKKIEDIMLVNGIKEAVFSKIKQQIRVK